VAARRNRRKGLESVRLTTPQRLFVSDPRRLTLWRDGNRLGKSFAAAWEIVHRARGSHPYLRTHRPPIRILCVSYSYEQMEPLMAALWALLPKDEIDPRNGYDEGRGITGKPPRIRFVAGPGKGSLIQFATYKAGSQRVAGGAYHFIVCDEPPTESMYGELKPRILSTRGTFRMCFTPTPDSPPLQWLRDLVEAGVVAEWNHGLSEANAWPEDPSSPTGRSPFPMYSQAQIDEEVATWLEVERAMRVSGAWEPVVTGRWLKLYTPENVARFSLDSIPRDAFVALGVDHGASAGKQAAVLEAFGNRLGLDPRVWILDERISDGFTTPAQDAAEILAMLRQRGLVYRSVDGWIGDRSTGENRFLIGKSNRDLQLQLARLEGLRVEQTAPIETPRKFHGSVFHGLRKINGLCGSRVGDERAPGLLVHERCTQFRAFCETFAGDSRDPLKDVGDAGRYPIERWIRTDPSPGLQVAHLG